MDLPTAKNILKKNIREYKFSVYISQKDATLIKQQVEKKYNKFLVFTIQRIYIHKLAEEALMRFLKFLFDLKNILYNPNLISFENFPTSKFPLFFYRNKIFSFHINNIEKNDWNVNQQVLESYSNNKNYQGALFLSQKKYNEKDIYIHLTGFINKKRLLRLIKSKVEKKYGMCNFKMNEVRKVDARHIFINKITIEHIKNQIFIKLTNILEKIFHFIRDLFKNNSEWIGACGMVSCIIMFVFMLISLEEDSSKSKLNYPFDITSDKNENIYIADTGNNRISKIDSKNYEIYRSTYTTAEREYSVGEAAKTLERAYTFFADDATGASWNPNALVTAKSISSISLIPPSSNILVSKNELHNKVYFSWNDADAYRSTNNHFKALKKIAYTPGTYYNLNVTGGRLPYKFNIDERLLPTGLVLNKKGGQIHGVPANIENYSFSVHIKNNELTKNTLGSTKIVNNNIIKKESSENYGICFLEVLKNW